jgi:phosphoribosyl 1,2-cyclic phosphodiesterase
MKLTFLGTRANIEAVTRRHRRPSALLVEYRRRRVMIDCGIDWLRRVERVRPDAIVVTHAHPDHAGGLKQGAPCPVYATAASWTLMADYPIDTRHAATPRVPFDIAGITFEAFPVDHSLRAPAVGYHISAGRRAPFYVPDLVAIADCTAALCGIALYVGDGTAMKRPLVRQREGAVFGHTTIRAQLGWCSKEGVHRAIFTHCGSEIVAGDARRLGAVLREMAREQGITARFAYDGLAVTL